MANQNEVLRALSNKEEAASPASLAGELRAGEATVRTYLNRLKKRGYVDGGGSAWYITDAGKASLERVEEVPTTKEDVGEDELSKYRYYGELSGNTPDLIDACVELFQNTDMRSMDEMERVMAEMNVPQTQRIRWGNLYRGYLRNTTPPEARDELYPLPKPEEVASGDGGPLAAETGGRGERLDYIVEGNDILQVGEGLGMFTFRQALQVVAAKRGTAPQSPAGGLGPLKEFAEAISTLNPNKPMTVQDFIEIANALNESRGGGGELPSGFYVDPDGNVQELKPGQPLVFTRVIREPGKTYLLNPDGELEEHVSGKPIIIKLQPSPGSGSNLSAMMPFPVFGSDGQPAYDKDGKPIFANLEPMMKYMGFQSERRRAEERHGALMGLAKTARENLGDGIAALKAAAEGIKGGTGAKPETKQEQPQLFECADCHTQFSPPPGWAGQNIKCPNPACGREFTKEELLE